MPCIWVGLLLPFCVKGKQVSRVYVQPELCLNCLPLYQNFGAELAISLNTSVLLRTELRIYFIDCEVGGKVNS
jgi:hypothetical protein